MRLADICIYPLKSCRGNSVAEVRVEAMGLQYDRRWMLITSEGRFMTGREFPRLVLIDVQADAQGARFSAPGSAALQVSRAEMNEPVAVEVWRSQFDAFAGSWKADFWFSDYLGLACRLVHVDSSTRRRTTSDPDVPVGFADGYPLLLIGSASLEDLNARLVTPVSMRQFRPNLVVPTRSPFVEDTWGRIRVGEVVLESVKQCARCIFTTVHPDQATLHPKQEPLQTLNAYRTTAAGTMFGINMVARRIGHIRLGDAVEVIDYQ